MDYFEARKGQKSMFESLLKNKADAAQNEQGARAREPP
jgi:hypothetical protein